MDPTIHDDHADLDQVFHTVLASASPDRTQEAIAQLLCPEAPAEQTTQPERSATSLEELYAAIDQWVRQYREAHPDDDRGDLDILLDPACYPDGPYWPQKG